MTVKKPWGSYTVLESKDNFQVKRIDVNPKQRLSLQKHKHRSEHWIIVKGTAKVTNADKEFILTENESTFIAKEAIHRLKNPGDLPLSIIEIQYGNYLGEDDIERFQDDYNRI